MKFDSLAVGAEVATIKLKVLKNVANWTEFQDYINNPNLNNPNNYYEFVLHPVNSEVGTTIYNNTYSSVPRDDMEFGENILFEYYIEFPNPNDPTSNYDDILIRGGAGDFFRHINPEIEWHGNGRMEIDYIVLEDHYHRQARLNGSNSDVFNMLNTRLQQIQLLPNSSNISHYYTKDEPFQGQFSMYDKIESLLENEYGYDLSPKLITATHLEGSRITKPNNNTYEHYLNFLSQAKPRTIAVDAYPLSEWNSTDIIQWNNCVNPLSVQKQIDGIVTKTYKSIANAVRYNSDASVRETDIVYIPQIYGEYVPNATNGVLYWRMLKPPRSMNKCLQLLPLCYSADGILDFTLLSGDYLYESSYYRRAPLMHGANYAGLHDPTDDSAFEHLTEANQKIATYGPYLREQNWIDTDCLMTYGGNDGVNVSPFLLTDLRVLDPNTPPPGGVPPVPWFYDGFIQCGYYKDDQQSPSFMLVNRRAVYRTSAENTVVQLPVDDNFVDASPQTVIFVPSSAAETHFGREVGLYDPYDGQLYRREGSDIRVSIGPGDGKMLEMCGTLPALVTSDADIKNIAYLSGSITIDQGAEVTIHPGTETKIFANSTIMVTGGSTLNISGIVDIADSVSIIVESGSNVIFNDATCNWGVDSYLQVDDSGITVANTILQNATTGNTWRGLRITNADTIDMTNTTITGARSNEVTNSQVLLTDCRFNIPNCGSGLTITNSLPSHSVRITSTVGDKGFYSMGANNYGLIYENPNASLCLSGMIFDGLFVGFGNGPSSAVGDTIQYCYFSNNTTGIHLVGHQYSPLIRNCTFSQNDMGAYFEVSSPKVMDCRFLSCDVGIRTELATSTAGGIYDSIFSSGEIGIVSRGSNQRVTDNKFYTNTGILNHSGSILNMGNTANNLFKAEHANLKFQDTASYTARVQLYEGHNDFYHKNSGLLNPSFDFHFDSNWYASPPPRSNAILANYNWFEDGVMKVICPGTPSHYVYCNNYDPSPNVFLENNDRMAQALSAELAGNYLAANDTYKMILDENEISEAELLFDAMDAYYRTADLAGVTNTGAEAYLLAKIDQYETDNSILAKYLEDYLIKYYLQAESFQAAIDLLELRILNTECPIDSLHAVMDLEIVLQLAAMSESKKPINTKFTQYKYPDRNIFIAKHEENWELLDELLNGTKDEPIPIPDKPLISSNYPNPFNPSTTIAYSVPKDGLVRIGIYNIKGQKVKDLCNSEMQRGHHKILWDGKDANQRSVSSGVYFVKLQASGAVSTRKIMLMK